MNKNTFLMSILFILIGALSVPAADIIWVDEDTADESGYSEWETLLESAGHTVTHRTDMTTLDDDKIETLNAADLVIIGRRTNSGAYIDDDEINQWNGLTVPLILCNVYLARSSRWQWLNNTDVLELQADDSITIEQDHPMFHGVGDVGDEITMLTGPEWNILDINDAGNGQVLATHSVDGWLWIVYWDSETPFYDGSSQQSAWPRLWFCAGTDDAPGPSDTRLTPEGQALFINAVNFMAGAKPRLDAFLPNPSDGQMEVPRDASLSWKSGAKAVTHNVYLGTDFNDVNQASPDDPQDVLMNQGMTETSYDPPGFLESNKTYYWRVDEVNTAQPDMPYRSDVWSFTTGNYLVVDDFEAYNDLNEGQEGCNRIYLTWSDGYYNPSVNGSTIGYPDPDFANGEHFVETEIVNGGSQSAPLLYNNTTANYSEVTLSTTSTAIGNNWTQKGINTLSLWFYGDPNNPDTEQLYVKLNNSKIVYDGDAAALSAGVWTQWEIALNEFGIGLSNVTQLVIGMEKTGATGTEGILFLDDIRLSKND